MTKRFRLAAWLRCADIKLFTEVSKIVAQEERPGVAEAREALWAEADVILASEGAGDCHSELSEVTITGPLSEKKLEFAGHDSYAQAKEKFAALWPRLALGLFIPERNFYHKGGDPYASRLKDADPLHVFRAGTEGFVLAIDGDMLEGHVRTLFDLTFWLQAWVTAGDRGPRIPPDLSLDAANDAQLPQSSDFPPGAEFVIKEFDVPLVRIPGQGWFNWFGGKPHPYDASFLQMDNNWPATSFEEWLGVVEASLRGT